jgi:hypothetical protein
MQETITVVALFISSVVIFKYGIQMITPIVAILLPGYNTYQLIDHKQMEVNEERKNMLIYWTCYTIYELVTVFTDFVLSWFPMYYTLKLMFVLYLQFPIPYISDRPGAEILYERYLSKFMEENQERIEGNVERMYNYVKMSIENQYNAGKDKLVHIVQRNSTQIVGFFTKKQKKMN